MAVFTDTVTIFNKISDTEWKRTVVEGVQWSDKTDKKNENGRVSVAKYAVITFPEGTYESLDLNVYNDGDCIVYGAVADVLDSTRGNRVSDLLERYHKSGTIQSVNDNSNRDFLKNFKVVVA